ncbi:MAG: histidine phosphatase family protein [Armatimonadota bacterium]
MAQELILVRHGDIGAQYCGRFVGSTDAALSDEGLAQASSLATVAKAIAPSKCFCSPLLRTRETADAMFRTDGYPYEVDPNLREVSFGRWECMTFEQITASDPEYVNKWSEYSEDFSFPDGESARSFLARVHDFGVRAADEPAHIILAVTHGGVIRALICYFLGLNPRNYILFDVKPASVSRIAIYGSKGVLTQLNDRSHLEECRHG